MTKTGVSILVSSCWPGLDEDCYGVSECLQSNVLDFFVIGFHVVLVTFTTQRAPTICQGMSWQHLHQPCVAGEVFLTLSFNWSDRLCPHFLVEHAP